MCACVCVCASECACVCVCGVCVHVCVHVGRGEGSSFEQCLLICTGIDLHIGMPKSEFWRMARQVVTVRGDEYKKYQIQLASNPLIDQQLLVPMSMQPTDFLRVSCVK